MNHLTLLLLLATLLLISACAGMSREDNDSFRSDVANIVSANMPLSTAEERLTKRGFSCDERSAAPAITCTRIKDNILLFSCMQRVNLITDSQRTTVVSVAPKPIACCGF